MNLRDTTTQAERVRALGGRLRIASSPGSGLRLDVELPLPGVAPA